MPIVKTLDTDSAGAPDKGVGCGALVSPPMSVRLSFEANRGTPCIASIIAKVLSDAGAFVTFGENAAEMPSRSFRTLAGLHVHIDRLTWVRDEEAVRWVDRSEANVKVSERAGERT